MKRVIILTFFFSSSLLAQIPGKIAGMVRDRATREPIPGVNVTVKGTRLGATTDANGEYFILNVPSGRYEVRATLVGYQSLTQTDVVVSINRTFTVNFTLSEAVVGLDEEIVVTAERPDVSRERTSSSEIVRTEETLMTPGMQNLEDVLTLSADVTDGHFRGGREGEELYTLAGMGIVNPLTAASAFVPIVSAVEEVEVITSGFGAQYGNAQSGVVNISMKEGSPARWKARLEARTRVPGYKHFGSGVFDEASNPYLTLLNSPEKWLGIDSSRGGVPYYATLGYGFTSRYQDSAVAAQVAYALWTQARRDLNRQYDDTWDKTFDLNLGGPLAYNLRLFIAAHLDNIWGIVPADESETNKQVMGNLVYDLAGGMSLRLSGAYSDLGGFTYRGINESSYNDFRYWVWDRVVGLSTLKERTLQLGLRFAHAINPQTFYEVKLNTLRTRSNEGAPVLSPDRYRDDISDNGAWRYYETPDFFRVGHMDNAYLDEKTSTISLDGNITTQITPAHLVNSGVQLNAYTVDVTDATGLSSPPQAADAIYKAHPLEFALYFQDKMEFEAMIANVGLRWDVYNQNVDYYQDFFYPVEGSPTAKTPTIARLQPRIGISFPVSVGTVFHLNYGSFLQRPSFERTVYTNYYRASETPIRLGNPRLLPQETRSYEVGLTQGLGEGFTLDLSGYYKDVSNLIERAYLYNSRGASYEYYETYINRDYADIRGFRVSVTKRRGWLTGSVKYNYGVATGKSATPFDASPIFREDPSQSRPDDIPDPRDILLDFDRTHNVVLTLAARSPEGFGPAIAGFHLLENWAVSVKSFIRSGRPYTYNAPGDDFGQLFNKRSPTEQNTDLKIMRDFPGFFRGRLTLYLEVLNLFNDQIYSYNTVFRNDINVQKYHTNPAALQWFDQEPQFLADQTFLIYANQPRSFILGITMDF